MPVSMASKGFLGPPLPSAPSMTVGVALAAGISLDTLGTPIPDDKGAAAPRDAQGAGEVGGAPIGWATTPTDCA